jgi:group I intron endonuclease
MAQNYIIYKITSPSGKNYIGQTINFKTRLRKYKYLHCKNQPKLYNSFLKYGFENHNITIILKCKKEELNEKERYYQELYDCINNGLNCIYTETNNKSRKLSNESKLKISNFHKGKKLSKEHKEKIGKGNKGKIVSFETRINISKGKQNISLETREKMANNKRKKIIDIENNIIYNSIIEASEDLNIKRTTLNAKLSGQNKNNTNLRYLLCNRI